MNCVVICCDTFRYDMINHPVVKVPNIDRLVREGINFTSAFAEGLPTVQARRTFFTGVRSFPWRFEMDSRGLSPQIPGWHRIPDDQTTLAEYLLEKSVVTGLIADTYHIFKPTQNFTRGFSSWRFTRGQEGDPLRSGPISKIDVSPYHPEGKNDPVAWPTLTQYLLNMLDRETEEDYLTARLFADASTWLEENHENAPWFLWVDSFAPHERWDPPFEFADAYYTTDKSRNYIQPQLLNKKPNPTPEEIERTKALYYGYVTFVDKWIGVFLDRMEQLGMMDDTTVIFTSDHGTELHDRDKFGKGGDRLYAYNTQLPFVVRLPGGKNGGTTRDDYVQPQDMFPTICKLMGCDVSGELELDGKDVLNPGYAPPEKVITGWSRFLSVRDRDWNMVIDFTEGGELKELYDLRSDPREKQNVYDEHPEIVRELTDYLEATLGKLPYEIKHKGDRRQAPPLWFRYRYPPTH